MIDQVEDPTVACIELLATIQQIASDTVGPQERDKQLAFALYDLFTKVKQLPPDMASQFYERAKDAAGVKASQAVLTMLTPDLPDSQDQLNVKSRIKADAVIVTVIREEKSAALRAFGIDHRQEPTYEVKGRLFFLGRVSRPHNKRDLIFYVTMIGEPQNVPCANACRDIIEKFEVDCLVLSGIAGGHREKIGQGDVIAPLSVYYTEGGKRHRVPGRGRFLLRWPGQLSQILQLLAGWFFGWATHIDPSLSVENTRGSVKGYLQNFDPSLADRTAAFDIVLKTYEPAELGSAVFKNAFDYVPGMLMCGEKVLVDDSIKQVSESVERKIWAVDMESYGFAATCNHCDQEWAVFRGISDYADVKKDDSRHKSASIAAAVTARLFLTEAFRPIDERREF
jgi:nucleoside phosphorylase